jgi:hypothetical protein
MRAASLLPTLFVVVIALPLSGGQNSPTVKCIYADTSSNPGDTGIHDGSCQQCGTDGQWFDVQGVKCPGCQGTATGKQKSHTSQNRAAKAKLAAPEINFCKDTAGKAYSIGALRHSSQCLRCDTHATFSPDNEENCKVCTTTK